jgi:acylphosphatase
MTVTAENGRVETVVEEIIKVAKRLNGTATKGVPDNGRIEVLAELPANRVAEFKNVVAIIGGVKNVGPTETIRADAASNQKISILVQVTEAK